MVANRSAPLAAWGSMSWSTASSNDGSDMFTATLS